MVIGSFRTRLLTTRAGVDYGTATAFLRRFSFIGAFFDGDYLFFSFISSSVLTDFPLTCSAFLELTELYFDPGIAAGGLTPPLALFGGGLIF